MMANLWSLRAVFLAKLVVGCVVLWTMPATAGTWTLVGTGDCPGRDVAGSTGPTPLASKCDAKFAGFTAVCWAGNCTYKNVATAACTGGANPGKMYTCSAEAPKQPTGAAVTAAPNSPRPTTAGQPVAVTAVPAQRAVAPTNSAASNELTAAVQTLRGNSTRESKARALASLEQLARNGNVQAMVMTAACYRAGLGTARADQVKAFEWYKRAAEAGEPSAMIEMSRYYAEGVWIEPSATKSKQWLKQAAAAGSAEAKWQLSKGGK